MRAKDGSIDTARNPAVGEGALLIQKKRNGGPDSPI